MADVTISYKGDDILELSDSGSATLKTGGKYCEDDIAVEYVKQSGEGLGAYQLLNTITVEDGVSSIVITLPSGYTEYGLYVDALTSSDSVRKLIYHTSVASSRRLGQTNTSNTWSAGLKIKQIDIEPLGEHSFDSNYIKTVLVGATLNFSPEVVNYTMPQSILIVPGSGTLTGGTIEVYGR